MLAGTGRGSHREPEGRTHRITRHHVEAEPERDEQGTLRGMTSGTHRLQGLRAGETLALSAPRGTPQGRVICWDDTVDEREDPTDYGYGPEQWGDDFNEEQ
jgi:hypothetical protein